MSALIGLWLLCPWPAPRYRIDVSTDFITWEQANVITNNSTLILDCEIVERRFWRILPLQDP